MAVTTTRDCTWSATAGVPWVTLGQSAGGQGTGSFDFTIAANSDVAARSGTIDVNGQKVTISEQPAPCQYTVSPGALGVPSAGGIFSVSVQTRPGCSWTAASNDPWIDVRTASGTGNAAVQLSIAANAGTARTASVTIAGQTIAVSQADGSAAPPPPPPPPPNCSYNLTPTSQAFTDAGGTGSVSIVTTGACAWTVSSSASWIAVTSATSGSGTATVSYAVAPNTGAARSGMLTIAGLAFTVTQAAAATPPACSYSVSPGNQRIGPGGGQVDFGVSTGATCAWSATANDPWLAIASGAIGTGNGSVVLDVQVNSGGTRVGSVTIAGQTVTVRQSGADANISGPVAQLSGSCPTLQFAINSSRVMTDSSTAFKKGPCKDVANGSTVNVLGTLQSDLSVLATELTLLTKH